MFWRQLQTASISVFKNVTSGHGGPKPWDDMRGGSAGSYPRDDYRDGRGSDNRGHRGG